MFPSLLISHKISFFVIFCYVLFFPILVFPNIFVSTRKIECSLNIHSSILPFAYILTSIRVNHYTQTIWFSTLNVSFILGLGVFIPKFYQLNTGRSFPPKKDFSLILITKQRGSQKNE